MFRKATPIFKPLNSSPSCFSWTYLMAYSRAKLQRSGNKEYPVLAQCVMRTLDNCLLNTTHRSFKNVTKFKYLGMTYNKNENLIQEEITSRLISGNACYRSVQNLLSSYLQSENIKIKIHKTIIFLCFISDIQRRTQTVWEEYWVEYMDLRVMK
jgi:hypothetical protein